MAATDYEALAVDLLRRTERAVETIAALAVDTGVTFKIDDVVQRVEDELPADYPAPTEGSIARRDVIAEMAGDILSGVAFEG
ncbi:hypothetical protein [Streptomyces harbinensis]